MVASQELSFRSRIIACRRIFDLFAIGYDHLDVYLQLPPDEAKDDAREKAGKDAQDRGLTERIRLAGGTIPREVREYLALPPDEECKISYEFLLRLYFTLKAIDEASEEINIFRATPSDDNPMAPARALFEERRRLNSDSTPGRVLFRAPCLLENDENWARRSVRLKEREIPRPRGQQLSRRFENLCHVPALAGSELDYEVIPPARDVILPRSLPQLTIGVVPLIDTLAVGRSECRFVPGPLRIRVEKDKKGEGTCSYVVTGDGEEISPTLADRVCARLADRAEAAVRFLRAQGVLIALFPELVVPNAVVRRIKRVLEDTYEKGAGLQLVVAGSYGRGQGNNGLPYNEAIVLNGRGEELWSQRKLHYYEMHPDEQERCGLDTFFKGLYAREAVATHPRILRVRDSPALGRLAVLICEDVAQPTPGLHSLTALQVNYVFTPVMAGALEGHRWCARQADRVTSEAGAICVVANSGAIANAEWGRKRGHPPLGIVSLPLIKVAKKTQGQARPARRSGKWAPPTVTLLDEHLPLPSPPGGSVLLFRCPVGL